MTFLAARNLVVRFGGVLAIDDMTVSVAAGAICGVVGPNGSGKTTFLGVISGLVPPTSGSVELNDRPLDTSRPANVARAGVARTFQHIRLAPELTVLENVMTGAGLHLRSLGLGVLLHSRARDRDLRKLAHDALSRVGVDGIAGRLPSEIPYGHRRRVEIARAIAMQPRLLLLDEPAAGMTREERVELVSLIKGISDSGVTQILVEHDFALIQRVCDRVVVLNSGRIIADGVPSEVSSAPAVQEVYLGVGRRRRIRA